MGTRGPPPPPPAVGMVESALPCFDTIGRTEGDKPDSGLRGARGDGGVGGATKVLFEDVL